MARDFDILLECVRLLTATSQFDAVTACSTPEISGRMPASQAFGVGVEQDTIVPSNIWDGDGSIGIQISSTFKITFIGRHDDPILRDKTLDRLINVAATTIGGGSILGVTIGDSNQFKSHKWMPATPPERRVVSIFQYVYTVDGDSGYDLSPA